MFFSHRYMRCCIMIHKFSFFALVYYSSRFSIHGSVYRRLAGRADWKNLSSSCTISQEMEWFTLLVVYSSHWAVLIVSHFAVFSRQSERSRFLAQSWFTFQSHCNCSGNLSMECLYLFSGKKSRSKLQFSFNWSFNIPKKIFLLMIALSIEEWL